MKLTLKSLADQVSDEHDAYLLLEELRWHGTPFCAHCGHDKAYFLTPKNGTSRATGPKRTMSVRRVWKCAKCRKQFSVLTNTIFHGTKVPLRTWLTVMVQMSSAKNGMSAREVERMHGVTPETAWFMLHRLREAMKRAPLDDPLSGVIVADETWIGGEPKNRHKSHGEPVPFKPSQGNAKTDKTSVLSLIDAATGEVRSASYPMSAGQLSARPLRSRSICPSRTFGLTGGEATYRSAPSSFPTSRWTTVQASTSAGTSPRTGLRDTSHS